MNNVTDLVNVSVPSNPNFTSVALPTLPEGYKWNSQFNPVDIFGGPYNDTWELRIEDNDNNIVAIDYAVHEADSIQLYPTVENFEKSAMFCLGQLLKAFENGAYTIEGEKTISRREFLSLPVKLFK